MAYDISNIIKLTSTVSASGIGTANFASALWLCPNGEIPDGETASTYKTYSLSTASAAFATDSESYDALVNYWLAPAPQMSSVIVWFMDGTSSLTEELNAARNATWWFWTLVDQDTLATAANVTEIATWCNTNSSMFVNCQADATAVAAIRDEDDDTDIATTLTSAGQRYTFTAANLESPYMGIALAKWYAAVNYDGSNTCITGEFKTLSGVTSEDLDSDEYTAMKMDTKNVVFYTDVYSQGSTDTGVVINSITHSSNGEFIDEIVNQEAIKNAVTVAVYNVLRGASTKVPQTTKGQTRLLKAVEKIGVQFNKNGYLGERSYTDPDTGLDAYTKTGFVMLSDPEDILDISSSDRAARNAAVIQYRLYPAGAVHAVEIEQTIYLS